MIFTNFKINETTVIGYDSFTSPINWIGCEGNLYGSHFINCMGLNGGALSWIGDNGLMEYGLFENVTSLICGGAVEVIGDDVTIRSVTFRNIISPLNNEAIYFSNIRGEKKFIFNKQQC